MICDAEWSDSSSRFPNLAHWYLYIFFANRVHLSIWYGMANCMPISDQSTAAITNPGNTRWQYWHCAAEWKRFRCIAATDAVPLKLKSLSVVKILFWKFPCSLRWQAQAVEHEHNSFDLCSKLPLQHCRHEDHHRHILGCCRNVQSGGHPFVFVQSDGNPFAFVQSDGNPFILAVQSDGNTFVFLAVRHPDGNTINSLE